MYLIVLSLFGIAITACASSEPTPPTSSPVPIPTNTTIPTTSQNDSDSTSPLEWEQYDLEDFSVSLPKNWESVLMEDEDIEDIVKKLENAEEEWAQGVMNTIKSGEFQDALKFLAVDIHFPKNDYASLNVLTASLQEPVEPRDFCEQMETLYSQMDLLILGKKCDDTINGLPVIAFVSVINPGETDYLQYQYAYIDGTTIWTLTMSISYDYFDEMSPVFEEIAETFKLKEQAGKSSEDTENLIEYAISNFSITFPSEWHTIILNNQDIDDVIKNLEGINEPWAQNALDSIKTDEFIHMVDLLAINDKLPDHQLATFNIFTQNFEEEINGEILCLSILNQYEQTEITLEESICELDINGLGMNKFVSSLYGEISQYQYFFYDHQTMWLLSFAVDTEYVEQASKDFEQIAQSFKINN